MKYIYLFIVTIILFSCATGTYITGKDFDSNKIKAIEKGKTTKNEVLNSFGQPHSKSLSTLGETWTYQYIEANSKATSYIFVTQISSQSNYKILTIMFDSKDIVQNFYYNVSNPDLEKSK